MVVRRDNWKIFHSLVVRGLLWKWNVDFWSMEMSWISCHGYQRLEEACIVVDIIQNTLCEFLKRQLSVGLMRHFQPGRSCRVLGVSYSGLKGAKCGTDTLQL